MVLSRALFSGKSPQNLLRFCNIRNTTIQPQELLLAQRLASVANRLVGLVGGRESIACLGVGTSVSDEITFAYTTFGSMLPPLFE